MLALLSSHNLKIFSLSTQWLVEDFNLLVWKCIELFGLVKYAAVLKLTRSPSAAETLTEVTELQDLQMFTLIVWSCFWVLHIWNHKFSYETVPSPAGNHTRVTRLHQVKADCTKSRVQATPSQDRIKSVLSPGALCAKEGGKETGEGEQESSLSSTGSSPCCTKSKLHRVLSADHCIFFLCHFHTFLNTPSTLNPKP